MIQQLPATMGRLLDTARTLLHQQSGPLTRELLLAPGRFGLGMLPTKEQPDAVTDMVCGYCSTGCGLRVHLKDGEAIGLTPTSPYPVNLGMACPKGWEALNVLTATDRATIPLRRHASGHFEAVSWPVAVDTFVSRMRHIQRFHGSESVAFLGSGQMPTEEIAFLGAFAKFGMGVRHGDANTRQCMATAAVAYKQSFGFDAPPFTYADLEQSDVLIFIGANPCIAHPILWERVMRNRRSPQIVVIDPRRTETAMQATWHLPLRPKSDLVLHYGLARQLIAIGAVDQTFVAAHTSGFDDFQQFVQPYTQEVVAAETGLPGDTVERLARLIQRGTAVSFWWTMGVNQSHEGVRTAQAIINLALMTGNIGRPGTGANSITGQCNAMGSRLFSNTTGLLGGRDFLNPDHRGEVARILNIDETVIPHKNSLAYPEILSEVRAGRIRALWVVGTNPAHSWIDQSDFHELLDRLDFLVVQDMYLSTETASKADLVLPAAGWGEKAGTVINSERRIGLIKKVTRAPGQALADFHIFRLLAEGWGVGEMFREWTSPAAVFQILKRLSRGRPCDISGIRDYAHIDECGGLQWPVPESLVEPSTERRLFADGGFFHVDGRARFVMDTPVPLPEPPDAEFPLLLLTGRGTVTQWHTETRTAKSVVLKKLAPPDLQLAMHPDDAERWALAPESAVTVESRYGTLDATVLVSPTVQKGNVFLPMHHPSVNQLTAPQFDPHSRQPSYKATAIRVRPRSQRARVIEPTKMN